MEKLKVIDSHTGGEPTRIIVDGGPDLGRGPLAERRKRLQKEFDRYRSAVVNEPRGSDVIVGAILVEPVDPTASAGVIFFNNVGTIGMCGHGTIGLVVTLAHMGRIKPGAHRIETPVGTVTATLEPNGEVSVQNVPSWRSHKGGVHPGATATAVKGDVAWGGNWFFLVEARTESGGSIEDAHRPRLAHPPGAERARASRTSTTSSSSAPPQATGASARNFVLCPGKAYDRSPCGTGTSAKLACLAADGKLAEGAPWVQESIIGSTFTASYKLARSRGRRIVPTITGTAFVNAESTLLLDERDPFCWGIR